MRGLVLVVVLASCNPRVSAPSLVGQRRGSFDQASPVAKSVRRSTPQPVKLARREQYTNNLVADASGLYWTQSGEANSVWFLPIPLDGRPPRMLWSLEGRSFAALALDATSVYIAVAGHPAEILRGDKKTGSLTTIASDTSAVELLYRGALYARDTTNLYRFDGATRVTLAQAPRIAQFDVSARHVVYAFELEDWSVHLARIPISGGKVEVLVDNLQGSWALDGTSILAGIADRSLSRIGPDSPTPVSIEVAGSLLGVTDDKLVFTEYGMEQLVYVYSRAAHTLSPPVSLGRGTAIEDIRFSDGALWYVLHETENDSYVYNVMMFVP